ncbi:hypothetical protein MMC25_005005 [Agyrium rufum]|nr:hypothetical protein [Agyrium rufum]
MSLSTTSLGASQDTLVPTLSSTQLTSPLPTRSLSNASSERTQLGYGLRGNTASPDRYQQSREIIIKSYWPTVAIYASADTEELIRLKGIYGGFCGLLRPYGERMPGKVNIRDSVGGSKSWDNFGIRFIQINRGVETSRWGLEGSTFGGSSDYREKGLLSQLYDGRDTLVPVEEPNPPEEDNLDKIIRRQIETVSSASEATLKEGNMGKSPKGLDSSDLQERHLNYLQKILSEKEMVPHETFTHPVACVIAISSQSPAPIENLRELYGETNQGDNRVPPWAGKEFLRYYVLVHDEESDDIAKSTALFEQMKRHFGLHCHLLRLRSIECTADMPESVQVPKSAWRTAAEELSDLPIQDHDFGIGEVKSFIPDVDVSAVQTFIREMASQSIIPFMENRIITWNEQVASRRRGLSGRFISLSKRWTGFGSNRGSSPSPSSVAGKNTNFNAKEGYYLPESPESTMHRLADYAFMLRDWRLSFQIYDLLKTDFSDDKAWRHHASACEMAAFSLLLDNSIATVRSRPELLDPTIDSATYSYITRCSDFPGARRCLTVVTELLRGLDEKYAEDAARWAIKLLELNILSPISQVLTCEQIASCFEAAQGTGDLKYGGRKRKDGLWTVLAADTWSVRGFPDQARFQLRNASAQYRLFSTDLQREPWFSMRRLWDKLHYDTTSSTKQMHITGTETNEYGDTSAIDEESHPLGNDTESDTLDGYLALRARRTLSISDPDPLMSGRSTTQDEDGFE